MKKIMIGILFLIPIIILLLVAAITNIVSTAAIIPVESITFSIKSGEDSIVFDLNNLGTNNVNIYDYIDVEVLPEKATDATISWSIADVRYLDEDYEEQYNYYINNKTTAEEVKPAVMLVDNKGNEVDSNTSGILQINAYCSFVVRGSCDTVSNSVYCVVVGYDVESVKLVNNANNTSATLVQGNSLKLYANMTPVDSIVDRINWKSSNQSIAKVDANGIVTAVAAGTCYISCEASKYSNDEYVQSANFEVIVEKAGSVYGNKFYTHTNSLSLEKYGMQGATVVSGGSITDDELSISGSSAILSTAKGNVEIVKISNENALEFENAALLDSDSDEVIEVNGRPLTLSVKYKSKEKSGNPSVTWSTSNANIATVNNGVVTGISNGLVTITAANGLDTINIQLNVQQKVTSMSLFTSNTYYQKVKGGLAREVVFASERYIDFSVSKDKTANYTYIYVKGSESLSGEQLKEFNNGYNFEIISGGEYAAFDSDETNKLVFKSTLEGKEKQEIVIKVSAKYPKYVTKIKYTQEEVTVKAIYGVEVNEFHEFADAAKYQKTYAYKEGNVIVTKGDIHICYDENKEVNVSSINRYAICMMNDCVYPEDLKDPIYEGFEVVDGKIDSGNLNPVLYGSLYGNNHIFAGNDNVLTTQDSEILGAAWSDIVISNVSVLAKQLKGGDEVVSGDETRELKGKAINFYDRTDRNKIRLKNIVAEYSIFGNAYQAGDIRNVDITVRGCITRNTSNIGYYIPSWVEKFDGVLYPYYARITYHNNVSVNVLGSTFSFKQAAATKDEYNGKNLYVENDDVANEKYYLENYVDKGCVPTFTQTGFLDIYNWQSVEDVTLIDIGNDSLNDIMKVATNALLSSSIIKDRRCYYGGETYFNLGFIVAGLSTDTLISEKIYVKVTCEDSRIDSFNLTEFASVKDDFAAQAASKFNIDIYGYKNTSSLTPGSKFKINDAFIDKIHQ